MHCGVLLGRAEMMDDVMVKIVNDAAPDMKPWPEKVTVSYSYSN